MSKKPLIRSMNATMEIEKFPWWRVSPLSSASFLKGIFLHHIFNYFYNVGYNSVTLKCLGHDRYRT
tara:strand:- start:1434 stop:1631 length:198 start_codon:yes stop_codon:yes gene_type:complete